MGFFFCFFQKMSAKKMVADSTQVDPDPLLVTSKRKKSSQKKKKHQSSKKVFVIVFLNKAYYLNKSLTDTL